LAIPFFGKKSDQPKAEAKAALGDVGKFYIDLRPKLVKLPDVTDKKTINVRYPLIPPYSFAHIYWDQGKSELVYAVEEPVLNDTEKELLKLIQLGLEEMINISYIRASDLNVILSYLEKNVQSILIELGTRVSKETYDKIMYYIYRDSVGLNEIESLMRDYYIEDIECNGDNFPLYIVHRKYANIKTNVIFNQRQKLADFVEKLSQRAGRYVSYAKPILDGTLPDGSRVNATYTEDITTRGPTFTIRKFTKEPFTPIHLLQFNTVNAEALAFIWLAIEQKMNIMTIGETASGKTSFLNAIAHFIPPEARVCSIEDTREINLAHINWLPSVTRAGFGIPSVLGTQYGEITLFDLLRETFRQAPDYVILGETRGKETYVLFQGMSAGHPSLSTFHAGSVATLIRRLETPPIELPPTLIESLDLVAITTHIKTPEKSIRRMTALVEITSVAQEIGKAGSNKLFEWNAHDDKLVYNQSVAVLQKISKNSGKTIADLQNDLKLRTKLLNAMKEKGVIDFKEVTRIFSLYYKNREKVMKEFNL